MAETEKGRRREKERQQQAEEARKQRELWAVERAQSRENQRIAGEKAEQDRMKFYEERRFGNLLEARGPQDPTVQQAAKEVGFALPTGPTYDQISTRMRDTERAKIDRLKLEQQQRQFDAERFTPSERPIAEPINPADKLASLASTGPPQEEKKTGTDIYQGRITRPGGPAEGNRYFTDNPAAQPQELQGGLKPFQTHRLSPPGQAPVAPPSPITARQHGRGAPSPSVKNVVATEQSQTQRKEDVKKMFEPAPEGMTTAELLGNIYRAAGNVFGASGQPEVRQMGNDPFVKDIPKYRGMLNGRTAAPAPELAYNQPPFERGGYVPPPTQGRTGPLTKGFAGLINTLKRAFTDAPPSQDYLTQPQLRGPGSIRKRTAPFLKKRKDDSKIKKRIAKTLQRSGY